MNATVLSLVLATVLAPPAKTSAERSTRIYVRTTPPGASIVLDGKELGTSDGLFLVPPGVRTITLEMDGYDPKGETVDVKEGWITRVEVRMEREAQTPSDAIPGTAATDSPQQVTRLLFDVEGTPIINGKPTTLDDVRRQLQRSEQRGTVSLVLLFPRDTPYERCTEVLTQATKWQEELGLASVRLAVRGDEARDDKSPPEHEATIHDLDEGQGHEAIDLDTGKLYDVPKEIEKWEPERWGKWFEQRGIDLVTDHASNQWALDLIPPAVTLVPADDLKLHEAADRVTGVLNEKDDRQGKLTIHHDEGIDFLLLPKESKTPLQFAFRTAQGTEGFLQIVEFNETKPKSMRLRWKATKEPNASAKDAPTRNVHLPDADTEDTPPVLDLASGEMVKLLKKPSDYTKLGKGDIGFDSGLYCLRGGKVDLWKDGSAERLDEPGVNDDAKLYELPTLPCELLVTTPEKRQYLVKVLEERGEGGLNLEYRERSASDEPTAPAETGSSSTKEALPEGFADVVHLTIYDDSTKAASLVDLDTGKLINQPSGEEVQGMTGEEWMASKGIDAGCETNAAAPGLWGMDMVVLPVGNEAWQNASEQAIESELRNGKPGSPAIMSTLGGLPRTFYFTTREGSKGILQIVAKTEDEQGEAFEVKYRLTSRCVLIREAKAQMAAIETAIECYQLDTGESLPLKAGLAALLRCPEAAGQEKWNGPYVKGPDVPVDPWGNEYRYTQQDGGGIFFRGIVSDGPDGKPDTPDDLSLFDFPAGLIDPSLPPTHALASPRTGLLEFRVVATADEAKAFDETGEGLSWYKSLMKEANQLPTRKQNGQTEILLWQTPEKSMTASESGQKKWRVIEVSIMAEPDKPGRIGVVFDQEGGRRLKKLTGANVNRHMAMLVDGRVVCCPMIRAAIGPRVEITGNFSKQELTRLATALQAGMETSRPEMPATDQR